MYSWSHHMWHPLFHVSLCSWFVKSRTQICNASHTKHGCMRPGCACVEWWEPWAVHLRSTLSLLVTAFSPQSSGQTNFLLTEKWRSNCFFFCNSICKALKTVSSTRNNKSWVSINFSGIFIFLPLWNVKHSPFTTYKIQNKTLKRNLHTQKYPREFRPKRTKLRETCPPDYHDILHLDHH